MMAGRNSIEQLVEAVRVRGWRRFTRDDNHVENTVLGLKPWDCWPSWASTEEPQPPWDQYAEKRKSWARARALRIELNLLAGRPEHY